MASILGRAAGHFPADRDIDHNMSQFSYEVGKPQETDEERLLAQRNMQMLDLGTGRREFVTTVDKPLPRELRLSKQQLLRSRKVEEEGTEAAKLFQDNRTQVNAWNNISTQIAQDNNDREELDELMGGQSHRARLNRDIKEQGGQTYGEVSSAQFDHYPRLGRGRGGAGRGIAGRSGRGAPMHLPVMRTNDFDNVSAPRANGRGSALKTPSTPTGPKANRPLDPAIDPSREYCYKTKRGGRTLTTSYSDGKEVPAGPKSGRGKTPNNARATMIGSTVRIAPASKSKGSSEYSEPPRAPRMGNASVALDDQAFLKAMHGTPNNPTFNELVQAKSKPAPGSKAAALVERPVKPSKGPAAKKKDSVLAKSTETPAEAFRNLELHQKPSNAYGNIRLAPTHEFAFPPPNARANSKKSRGGNISVHTEGIESASTFDSADFATQLSRDAPSQLNNNDNNNNNNNHGTIIIGLQSTQKKASPNLVAKPAANGSGIKVLPATSPVDLEQKDDLIMLDEGSEGFATGTKAFSNNAVSSSTKNSMPSPGIPDIMDEDLDVGVFQSSLTPRSAVTPRFVVYRGARYIRADQITEQDVQDCQQEIQQEANGQKRTVSPEFELPKRVAVTSGLNIGLQTLEKSSRGSILGEHNLPGRSQDNTEASPSLSLGASRWARGNAVPALPVSRAQQSLLSQIRHYATPSHQPSQRLGVGRGERGIDTEMIETFGTPSAQKKMASAPDLTASKRASAGASIKATQTRTESVASPFSNRVHGGTFPTNTASEVGQDKLGAVSMSAKNNQIMNFSTPPRTGSLQAENPKAYFKAPNPATSMWADPYHEVKTLAASNDHLGNEPRQPGFQFASGDDADGEGDLLADLPPSHRKRNPFSRFARPSGAAAAEAPMPVQRSGNASTATRKPFRFGEGLAAEAKFKTDVKPSAFQFSQPPASSKPGKLGDSKWATYGQSVGSRITPDKANVIKGNLMASKYAPNTNNTSWASHSSFRKVRQRADSSSEESEI